MLTTLLNYRAGLGTDPRPSSTMKVGPVPKRMSPIVRPRTMSLSCRHLRTVDLPDLYPSHLRATPPCAAHAHLYLPLPVYQLAHRLSILSPLAVSRSNASARPRRPLTGRDQSSARAPVPRRPGQAARSTRLAVRRHRVQDHRLRRRSPCKRGTARSTSQVSLWSLLGAEARASESSSTRSGGRAHRACPRHSQRTHRTMRSLMHIPASRPAARRSHRHPRSLRHP